MILPSNEDCVNMVNELEDDPGLTQWESDFIDSCRGRLKFTDKQREVFAALAKKFEL